MIDAPIIEAFMASVGDCIRRQYGLLQEADVNEHCGGKGLNQSVALARAGVPVYHAGMIGEEGDLLIGKLSENGINTEFIRKIPGRSGHTIIQVDKNGQNSILLFGGANRALTEDYIDDVIGRFDTGDVIVLQNEVNLIDYIIDRAYERGMKIVFNPSPYDDAIAACDLGKVWLFFLNEIEGGQMTGETDPGMILDVIRDRYPGACTVLTLGADGSLYQDANGRYRQEIFRVKAVDTTAAGDTFTGYFVSAMIDGMEPDKGLELAAKASAIAVTRHGAADSIPGKEEVLAELLR